MAVFQQNLGFIKPLMKIPKRDQLIEMRNRGAEADRAVFREMITNSKLIAGKHFKGKEAGAPTDIVQVKDGALARIPINQLGVFARRMHNLLLNYAPNVSLFPKSGDESGDVTSTEIGNGVWIDLLKRMRFNVKRFKWILDIVNLGECVAKVSWDQYSGNFVGFGERNEERVDKISSVRGFHQDSYPLSDRPAQFTGDVYWERVLPWNLIRPEGCESIDEV